MALSTSSLVAMSSKRGTILPTSKKYDNSSKSFNIHLSRLSSKESDTSMLAYSEKLRTFKEARGRGLNDSKTDYLQVRAKHIPKFNRLEPKVQHRKSLSLVELTGRKARSLDGDEFDRMLFTSPRLSLPGTSSQFTDIPDRGSKISFVSATGNTDIVGYSIRGDPFSEQNPKSKVTDYLRSNILPPIPFVNRSDNFRKQLHVSLPKQRQNTGNFGNNGTDNLVIPVYKRPKRAKRMQLKPSFLHDIPEDDTTLSNSDVTENESINPSISQPRGEGSADEDNPVKQKTLPDLKTFDKLDRELVNPQQILIHINNTVQYSPRQKQLLNELRDDPSKRESQSDLKSVKSKHHKKAKRLIFLRDYPDDQADGKLS
ncbi:hypothetical protein SNE40_011878 [Patella caerulea]|uniref:Uncharacterized protein n=1 Tax=Patella caerulea TaxID=87958 RepID=A0AAN8PPW6_PATCE